jgi:molybdopterin/thiamine biosynthesis adenylyltransferase
MKQVKIVGAGGVGTILLNHLGRYLNYKGEECRITIIDDDDFEQKNRIRQMFKIFGNKAKVKATELAEEFENVAFRSVSEFVTPENIDTLIEEDDTVLACVDNHKTRKLLSDHCGTLDNVTLISGGNELTDGNVQAYIRREGKNITSPLTKYHREIRNPADKNPGELTCEERAQLPGGQQIIVTNMGVAYVMFANYWLIDEGKLDQVGEHFFDIVEGRMQLVERKEE